MFDSDRLAAAASITLVLCGCADLTAPAPTDDIAAFDLLLIAEAPDSIQPILITRVTPGPLEDVAVTVRDADGAIVASDTLPDEFDDDELRSCQARYGPVLTRGGTPRCSTLRWTPAAGASYTVAVYAAGVRTASAELLMPQPVTILRAQAEFDEGSPRSVDVAWSGGAGASRYYVSIQPTTVPPCSAQLECRQAGWSVVTTKSEVRAAVDPEDVDGAAGPWRATVLALDDAVQRALTSGSAEELFPIPPVSSVDGGYGLVGAWYRTTASLD